MLGLRGDGLKREWDSCRISGFSSSWKYPSDPIMEIDVELRLTVDTVFTLIIHEPSPEEIVGF